MRGSWTWYRLVGGCLLVIAVGASGVAAMVKSKSPWPANLATLGPIATTLTAAVALLIGVMTIRQKATTDLRDQWWKRVQWALDQACSDDAMRKGTGLAALTALVSEKTVSVTDATMIAEANNFLKLPDLGFQAGDVTFVLNDDPGEG